VVQVGLVFLRQERQVDYTRALEYLKDIMATNSISAPLSIVTDRELALIQAIHAQFTSSQHLLCRWHVNMDVLAKTKSFCPPSVRINGQIQRNPIFQDFLRSWNILLARPTKSIYSQRLLAWQATYPRKATKYCTDTWLIWKENIVAAWINEKPHFGVIVTSPVEGCHAGLKRYLQHGHGDLKGVFTRLKLYWAMQHSTIDTTSAQQQLRPRHSVNIPLLAAIVHHIHGFPLQKILEEQSKLPAYGVAPPQPCTCSIQNAFGLPCLHTIWQRQQDHEVVQLSDIHLRWHKTRPEEGTIDSDSTLLPLPVLNPVIVQGRGRPQGALGGSVRPTSTRRDPSAFEIPSSSAPPAIQPQERLYIVN
jgi:hypothetical protein